MILFHRKINYVTISNIVLILFFIVEATAKIAKQLFSSHIDEVSKAVKLLIISLLVFFLFKKKDYRFLSITFVIVLFYFIGHLSLKEGFSVDSLSLLLRYIFPLYLFQAYNKLQTNDKKHLFSSFDKFVIFNSFLIIFGFLLEIKLFETYTGNRFGYNGLISVSATSSYLYSFVIINYIDKAKLSKIGIMDIIVISSCFLIGTKAIYLAMSFTMLYLLYYKLNKHKVLISITFFILCITLGYIYFVRSAIFSGIIEKEGWLTAMLSYRDELFLNNTLKFIQNEWNFFNYLFGGYNDLNLRSQIGICDLFFMFGILGTITYLILYFKTLFSLKLNRSDYIVYSFIFFIVTISGNFFMYTTSQLFILIFKHKRINKF